MASSMTEVAQSTVMELGTSPRVPKSPEPSSMVVEPRLTHADVVRFMAREKMNRHDRKRDRWHQLMFS